MSTGQTQVSSRRARRVFPDANRPLAVFAIAAAIAVGVLAGAHVEWFRPVLALLIAANLLVVAIRWNRVAAVLTLLLLPFLALLRRLLIADTGWSSFDPLLLVAPVVALYLIYRLFVVERRPLARDNLSKLVLAFLALALLESVVPLEGSLLAGLGGLFFLGVPLLWFFIGRELGERRTVLGLMYAVVVLGVAIGAYGLWQTQVGLPSWDVSWVDINGFAALNVGSVIRPFGTFSSSAEYAVFLAIAIVFSLAMVFHRRALVVPTIPFLCVALFLVSSRAIVVLTILAMIILAALRTGRVRLAVVIVLVGVTAAVLAIQMIGPGLEQSASRSGNPLVAHQVSGLVAPTDPEKSTLFVHWELVTDGFSQALTHPLGQGTAVTNIAAEKFGTGGSTKGTEVDISNAFVSLGLLGGLLFLAMVFLTFRKVIAHYLASRDPAVLAVVGLLVVALGQWLNGGYYAVAPLTWFLIGWATGEPARRYER